MTAILEKKKKKKEKKNLFTQHPRRWRKKWPALNFYFVRSFIPADDSVWKVAKTRRKKKKGINSPMKIFFFRSFYLWKIVYTTTTTTTTIYTYTFFCQVSDRNGLSSCCRNEHKTRKWRKCFFPFPFLYTIRDFCYFVFPFRARAWVCRKSPPKEKDGIGRNIVNLQG